jgi:hypothetical protein
MRKAQIIETVNTARGRVPSQHPRPPPFASRQIFHEERKVSQCQEPPSKKFWRETQKWLKNSTSCRHPVSTVNTGWSWETSLLKPGIAQDLRACLKSSNEDGNEGKRENLSRNKKFAFTIFPKSAEFVEPAK